MYWKDEGYLLSKFNYNENSIIIDIFTLNHGKCSGIVYGGSSRKQKKNLQVGNKILLNFKTKGENKMGYFTVELIKPISPLFFDDKKKSICILSANSILKILLPEGQINKKIYHSFERLIDHFNYNDWIKIYIAWELSLIKELGFEVNFSSKEVSESLNNNSIYLNDRLIKIPKFLLQQDNGDISKAEIYEALIFNKNLFMQNFIIPHQSKFPESRNILENYFL